MSRFWSHPRFGFQRTYDVAKLVDCEIIEPPNTWTAPHQIICDIDKTYLETQFESFFQIAKIAFETAEDKRTVAGAKEVLTAMRWLSSLTEQQIPVPLHFVSSSPPQLRATLTDKLLLDGLDWSSTIFKNQVYNIVRGRFDLLRQHVAYKSAAILQVIGRSQQPSSYILIGDNAESDAFIYLGIALRLHGILDKESYAQYLALTGIDLSIAKIISEAYDELTGNKIATILIRNAPGYRFVQQPLFKSCFHLFDNYYQALLLMIGLQYIRPDVLPGLTRRFHNQYQLTRSHLYADLKALKEQADSENLKTLNPAIETAMQKIKEAGPLAEVPSKTSFKKSTFDPLRKAPVTSILSEAKLWLERSKKLRTTSESDH